MNTNKSDYRQGAKTQRNRKGLPWQLCGSGYFPGNRAAALLIALVLASPLARGAEAPPPLRPFPAQGTVQYAFTPDDDAAGLIIGAIVHARRQVLVQAYSFTHRGVARALIRAHQRGVDVEVIADAEQARTVSAHALRMLIAGGVPVLLDADHAAAHNKVLIIDPDASDCAVITGSYNLTYAAEYRNAENLLLLRSDPPLCAAYQNNWQQHRAHSHVDD